MRLRHLVKVSLTHERALVGLHGGEPKAPSLGAPVVRCAPRPRRTRCGDGELAEEFAGDGVDDADLEVLDEQDDMGSGTVVEPSPEPLGLSV